MRQTRPRRAAKKTAMLEVRVSPDDKQDFLDACRAAGISASVVVRRAMLRQVRIVQERTGRLKMMMSVMLLLPLMSMVPSDGVQPAAVEMEASFDQEQGCDPAPALWPMDADGEDLPVPEEGIRIILTYDLVDGRVSNVRPDAPQGSDAFPAFGQWCRATARL